jgi:fatty acid desaturase
MTSPTWTRTDDWSDDVPEPFRSDRNFWASVAASADAVLAILLAAAAAVALALTVGAAWTLLPFVVPAGLLVRAARCGRLSARSSREAFAGDEQWRVAERRAVAQVFAKVLLRRRTPAG